LISGNKDVDFVITHNGELPNKNNTTPLDGADGRGSCVWFNQATMFQSSELGYNTVQDAADAGVDTTCDAKALLQKGYFPTPT
jgi:hypothetical protein